MLALSSKPVSPTLEELGLFIDSETEPAQFIADKLHITVEDLSGLIGEDIDPTTDIHKKKIKSFYQ